MLDLEKKNHRWEGISIFKTGKQKHSLLARPPHAGEGEREVAGYCLGLHSTEEASLSPSDHYLLLTKRQWPRKEERN